MPTTSEQIPERRREAQIDHESDAGSITPLAIGFVVIALLLAFLIAALADLHMARRELQGLADSAARLLRNGGVFCLCHRPERLADVVVAFRSARLEPKRLRPVQQRASDAPWLMLWEARKNGRPGLSVLSPLVLKNPDGTPSQDYQSLFRVPDRQF